MRLEYALAPRDGVTLSAVGYVIGAPTGTLQVSVLGPSDVVAALDPDALVAAMAPIPWLQAQSGGARSPNNSHKPSRRSRAR